MISRGFEALHILLESLSTQPLLVLRHAEVGCLEHLLRGDGAVECVNGCNNMFANVDVSDLPALFRKVTF